MVFLNLYVRITAHSLYEPSLYLCTGIVSMMQYSEFRVAALTMQVKLAIVFFIEVHSPVYKFLYLRRSHTHYLFHGSSVRYKVTRYHSILDMFLEIIYNNVGN